MGPNIYSQGIWKTRVKLQILGGSRQCKCMVRLGDVAIFAFSSRLFGLGGYPPENYYIPPLEKENHLQSCVLTGYEIC